MAYLRSQNQATILYILQLETIDLKYTQLPVGTCEEEALKRQIERVMEQCHIVNSEPNYSTRSSVTENDTGKVLSVDVIQSGTFGCTLKFSPKLRKIITTYQKSK